MTAAALLLLVLLEPGHRQVSTALVSTALAWGLAAPRIVLAGVRRGIPRPPVTAAVLLGAVGCWWLTAGTPLAAAPPMLATATALAWRFTTRSVTRDGFSSGLLLGCTVAVSPALLPLALAVPAVAGLHTRCTSTRPRHGRAVTAVLGFPTLFLLGGWAFVQWRFAGSVSWTRLSGTGRNPWLFEHLFD